MGNEGLLSQDDINAALAEAGLDVMEASSPAAVTASAPAPAPAPVDTRVDSAGRPFDAAAAAMAEAIAAEQSAVAANMANRAAAATMSAPPPSMPAGFAMPTGAMPVGTMPFDIPELGGGSSNPSLTGGIDLLRDVELDVKIELGRSRMLVDDVLRLGEGSVVELDKLAGDPVDVFVNDRLVAHGEILVLNDNFCVRINDIVQQVGEEGSN